MADHRIARELQRLRHGQSEPVHAGIDVERRRKAPVRDGGPFGQFLPVAENRAQGVPGEGRPRAGGQTVEDVDRRLRQELSRGDPLGQVGDEDGAAAGPGQSGGDRRQAAAIGIGLHHGAALGLRGPGRQRAPVRDQRREIDRQARAVTGGQVRGDDQASPPGSGQGTGRVMTSSKV